MKSSKVGKRTLASVENITPFGVWLFLKGKEYFLSYQNYPYFQNRPVQQIHDVRLLHDIHLYWPALDVDLEINNLEHPEHYPLISRSFSKK
jgi:hypothetical protein